jgi:ABC-type Na+ efflux pump permease subunit
MRFLLVTLLTATLSFIAGLYLPWWSIAFVAFLVALLIKQKIGWAYLSAFTAIYFLWGGLAALTTLANHGALAHRVAQLLRLNGNPVALILVSATIGAIVAGFAAMSGSSLRPADRKLIR